MKDEHAIINKTALLKRIEELEVLKKIHCYRGSQPNENEYARYLNEQRILKQILSQSTPLIPEIENILKLRKQFYSSTDEKIIKDYISNLKLDI